MYNNKPHSHRPQSSSSGGRTNLASCIVATIFLLFVLIIMLIVFFSVFKPKDPQISVNAVQLPSFSVANGTITFTFSQYLSVRNPNRAVFTHYDSSLQLIYSGNQIGFMFIPEGKIDAGRSQFMAATFSVQSFPLSNPTAAAVNGGVLPVDAAVVDGGRGGGGGGGGAGVNGGFRGGVGPTTGTTPMEIESRMRTAGRVRVLHFFTHHVEAKSQCKVAIDVSNGNVLGFHC